MAIENHDGTVVITGDSIALYRLLALRGALKMEAIGLKRRGPSALSIVKREFGLKGSRQKIMDAFEKICTEAKAAHAG